MRGPLPPGNPGFLRLREAAHGHPARRTQDPPASIYDALFSVQYVTAAALAGRAVDLATFYDEPLDHPASLALAALTTCPPDTGTDFPRHFPGEVVIHLTDGRTLRRTVPASHGTPDDPMTDAEIHAKFHANAPAPYPKTRPANWPSSPANWTTPRTSPPSSRPPPSHPRA